jgi:flavin reductase (DIM6/NTAB) family NADH-FMN oxidoreductase RutF
MVLIMKRNLPAQPLLLPSPVLIIGSYDADGKPNIMNAAWGGIVCSSPPCISVSLRKATLTYHNILLHEAFTVNIPSDKYYREADYVGMVSGRDCEKFLLAKLTPEKSTLVNAPIVKEFPYALECKLIKHVELGTHTMFIGEIAGMLADNEVLGDNQIPDIQKVQPILWGSFGSMSYYRVGEKLGNAFSVGKMLIKKQITNLL